MEIIEVRIKLMEEPGERLQAFCSITFDGCFVVRDVKIIEGGSGSFVAMPSRKLTAHCGQCGCKNHLRAGYCNHCGTRLNFERIVKEEEGRSKLYADIAHPINAACREHIQQRVIEAYQAELEKAKLPGYVSTYDDFDYHEPAPAAAGHPIAKPHFIARREPPRRTSETTSNSGTVRQASLPREASTSSRSNTSLSSAQKNVPSAPQRTPDTGFGAGIFNGG